MTISADEILTAANVVIAVGTMILAYGIRLAVRAEGREERNTFYATLDRTYFEIQKLILDNPHLDDTDLMGKTPHQIVQYNAFAFIVWNFVESIYDYSREEKVLGLTWSCILDYESAKHAEWFKRAENRPKFKKPFVEFIVKTGALDLIPDRERWL